MDDSPARSADPEGAHPDASLDTARLKALLGAIPVGVIVTDADGHLRLVNQEAETLLGGVTGDAAGPAGGYILLNLDGSPFPTAELPLVRALRGEVTEATEILVRLTSGVERLLLASGVPYYDRDGAVAGSIGVIQDITIQKRAEEELYAGADRYRTLFSAMTEGFAVGEAIVDPTGTPVDFRLTEMNDAFERHTGLRRKLVLGRPTREVLPQLEQQWIDTYGRVAFGAAPVRFELYNANLDRHFSVHCFSPKRGQFAVVFTDISGHKRLEKALSDALAETEDERRRLSAVLDALPAGVAIAGVDGRMTQYNDALMRIWGGPPPDAQLGEHWDWRGYWPNSGRRVEPSEWALRRALNTGKTIQGDTIEIERFDGSGRATIINAAAPIKNAEGQVVGGVVAEVDITAQRRAEDRLREADRRKDEFIAVLSHELRNPLAPIRFALPMLARADLPEPAAKAVDVIDRQVQQLARLLDDLLDASRISSGKLELRIERVQLAAIVAAAVEASAPITTAARHQVIAAGGEGETWVDVDLARLTQVVTNLINNSARYTPRGGEIEVRAAREGQRAVIHVIDNGIGIPADALDSIFEMFRQVNHPDRPQGGLGIGLALSKRLVEMHGGTIEARSAGVGRGAEFIVRLPLAHALTAPPAAPAPPAPAPVRPLKVLVVDDNADLVELLSVAVRAAGHEVRQALDGASAIGAARSFHPDVVLLDVGLPVVSGIDVARTLRSSPDTAHSRLIAITGWGQAEDVARTRDAGFDDHLTKPVDPEALLALLRRIASGPRGRDA